jgi:hypothetical protein
MIVTQSATPVSASGISSEAFFTVKQENLPWIFGILRNSLYSDKPLAILREYSANALDAHAEAGAPNRPFVVSMPTALSPVLSIRDFGKGLSEDDVYNVFASYGESTKRNTNQQIGGFGIGSKSAFAYVNNFTIVSYFGGKKSIYEAFIDATNIGKVAKVIEEDTNEESGLEIIVNVKVEDIPAFVEAAQNLFKHFDTIPIIKNNAELSRFLDEYVAAPPVFRGKTWTLAKRCHKSRNSEACCVIGNIRYPIQLSKLQSRDVKAWIGNLKGAELVLRMPIGSAKISASRESLEYDEATIKLLEEKVREARREMLVQISDQLDACQTLWEVRILINKIEEMIGIFSCLPIWNGQTVGDTVVISKALNTLVGKGCLLKRNDRACSSKAKWWQVSFITPKADTVIYVDKGDVHRNSVYARIARDIEDNNRTGDVFLARFPSTQEAEAFVNHDEIVGANIVDVASIHCAPPKRNSRGSSDGVKAKQMYSAFVYNGNYYASPKSKAWDVKDIDVKNGEGVYVRIHSFVPVDEELADVRTLYGLQQAIHNLYILTGTNTEIFGFRTKVNGLGDGWMSLRKKIESVLKAQFADPDFQAIVMSAWAEVEINSFFIAGAKYAKSVSAHGKMGQLLNRLAQLRPLSDTDVYRLQAAHELAAMVQMTEELDKLCDKEQDELKRMVKEAKETYPMLLMARDGYVWETYKKEILGYIALVGQQ